MSYGNKGSPGTFKRWFHNRMPNMFRRHWGVRFGAGTLGALFDYCMQGILEGYQSPFIPHYDALRPLGNEQSMPQYPLETWTQYKDRLFDAWNTWDRAGDEDTITGQLSAAGNPGAQVFRFSETGSWSEFLVFYPSGSHPVTGEVLVGGFTVGDGTAVGPVGISPEQLNALKDCIIHWKPARWKCPWLIFEVSGETYGTGHTYGEAGLVYGGTQVRTSVQS